MGWPTPGFVAEPIVVVHLPMAMSTSTGMRTAVGTRRLPWLATGGESLSSSQGLSPRHNMASMAEIVCAPPSSFLA